MPFVPIPSTVRLAIRGSFQGQQIVNVLHYRYPGAAPDTDDLIAFCLEWWTNHGTAWRGVHSDAYSVLELVARDIATAGGAQGSIPLTANNTGTIAGDPCPGNVAVVISWRTGLSGRTARGRTYIGPIPEPNVSGNTVNSGLVTVLATLAGQLIGAAFTDGYELAIASLKDGLSRVVISSVIDALVDSQRRRLTGRGS